MHEPVDVDVRAEDPKVDQWTSTRMIVWPFSEWPIVPSEVSPCF